MALSIESISRAAKAKAARVHAKVRAAENELRVANASLLEAVPRNDVAAIERASRCTVRAELEVRSASEELEVLNHLLEADRPILAGGASGQGVRSLVERMKRQSDAQN